MTQAAHQEDIPHATTLAHHSEWAFRRSRDLVSSMKTTAHKYTFGAPYESGPLGTTSFDKGYGLVDVVAAAQSLAP